MSRSGCVLTGVITSPTGCATPDALGYSVGGCRMDTDYGRLVLLTLIVLVVGFAFAIWIAAT